MEIKANIEISPDKRKKMDGMLLSGKINLTLQQLKLKILPHKSFH